MGYSYLDSSINRTIHIAKSVFRFPTKLSSVLQDYWYPTCLLEFGFPNHKITNTNDFILCYFRSLFKDDKPPIIFWYNTEVL